MGNTIKFIARDEYGWNVTDRPYPASKSIPQWWKDMTPYLKDYNSPNGDKLIIEDGLSNASPKKCIAMLDSITAGYIVPLWADVQIRSLSDSEYIPGLFWKVSRPVFADVYNKTAEMLNVPTGYFSKAFNFQSYWSIKTPPGYSIDVHHPYGYEDSVFRTIPGTVDSDRTNFVLTSPVFIKHGFEGIVEKGTPMIQIFPFKRENWKSEYKCLKEGKYEYIQDRELNSKLKSWYKKEVWSRKKYE